MNVDSYFTIGKGHAVCQDYAIAKMHGSSSSPEPGYIMRDIQRPYLIVSDGCSSSPQTDVGARILAHIAEKLVCESYEINFILSWETFGMVTIAQAQLCARAMGLPMQCLDATLLVGFERKEGLSIYMYGDGHILGISSDKYPQYRHTTIKYDHSAPYYLTYTIDPYRKDAYDSKSIYRHQIDSWAVDNKVYSPELENSFFYPYDDYKYIAIASDGLSALTNLQTGEPYPDHTVMDTFLAFKNTKGEFVKRRVKRAMRDLEEQQIIPGDDVSIAVLEIY